MIPEHVRRCIGVVEEDGIDSADRATSIARLEALILQRHEALFEVLALCRQYVPAQDAARLLPQVDVLESLVRLDTDRALLALRSAHPLTPGQDAIEARAQAPASTD